MKKSQWLLLLLFTWRGLAQAVSVPTYHNNNLRTGWNSQETILTPTKVTPTTFGLLHTVTVDGQVDAQPLVVGSVTIGGVTHTVVYAVTSNNTVYAIDGVTGAILLRRNLGTPISLTSCPNGGIVSTPVINLGASQIFVMAHVVINNAQQFQLHALSLSTLQDATGSPVTVTASNTLSDGTTIKFVPLVEYQRAALLATAGNIYAGFGSHCNDSPNNQTRGWLLGWSESNLAPLAHNELIDDLATAPYNTTNYFLSSIWMSGSGLAADSLSNIFFVTGNSDPQVDTYSPTNNLEESAVMMPPNLSTVSQFFTPANAFTTLDQHDADFGAGGIMVLPDQPGPVPHLATAMGKDARLFIINRDDMGGFQSTDVPPHVNAGHCWCAESYFTGSDGIGRVVTSGENQNGQQQAQGPVQTWTVNTSPSVPLTLEAKSPVVALTVQDPGFFTSVSSNGTTANTAIIWAVARPTGTDNHITLYAFNGAASNGVLAQLWSGAAGVWPASRNANLVPTVANGKVYVGSYQALKIFGLK